jgi:hypothetical protein
MIIGTLMIWTVKFFVRPFMHISEPYKPFVGLAPNLIGSFLLPFGACWLFPRIFGMQSLRELQIACWFGLILVVVNEYLQLIPFFGRTFDYLDILSSFIGVFVGYVAYAKLMVKTQLKTYP